MSSAFFLLRFGSHLKPSMTNSIFLSTGCGVISTSHTGLSERQQPPAQPQHLPLGSFPFQLATEGMEVLWEKAVWAQLHTCQIIPHILIRSAIDKTWIFEKSISLKKDISWCWSQRNAPIAATIPNFLPCCSQADIMLRKKEKSPNLKHAIQSSPKEVVLYLRMIPFIQGLWWKDTSLSYLGILLLSNKESMEEAKPRIDRNRNKVKTQIGHNKAKSAHACKPNSSMLKEVQALKKATIYSETVLSTYRG